MILAGDVGGTKTALALFEPAAGGPLRRLRHAVYPSREHASLEELVTRFLGPERPPLAAACFGVAGPVVEGAVQATNLPWRVEAGALRAASGAASVRLLNDVEAAAYGVLSLPPESLAVLQAGERRLFDGNVAVVAAGTGLGEAMLFFDGERHHPVASEGGHAGFAPRTEPEIELLRFLRRRFGGHASWERVLSGPGLRNLYDFERERSGVAEPAWLAKRLAEGDGAAAVSGAALAREDPVCERALERFVTLLGVEAGDLALRCVALGGVCLCGGIAPKILPALQAGGFLEAFADKGRFAGALRSVPVRVALDPEAPLLGAAHFALRLRPPGL
jgi:glucokinase